MDDAELLSAWREGDASAGDALFRRHAPALIRFFRTKIDTGVDDLVQQAMLRCVERREQFEARASFRTYVLAVARNLLYDELRKRMTGRATFNAGVTSLAAIGPTPASLLAHRREQRTLLEALRRVPIEDQVLLELYYWEDLGGPALGRILGLTEPALRSRLRRAKRRLRRIVADVERGQDPPAARTDAELDQWASEIRDAVRRPDKT